MHVIEALGWNKEELIGNDTVEEMLTGSIDVKTRKVHLKALCKEIGISEDGLLVDHDLKSFTTLLDLCHLKQHEIQLPSYLVEEDKILPRIKPRFYSLASDPYDADATTTNRIKVCFTLHTHGENREGLCTHFLASVDPNAELKC